MIGVSAYLTWGVFPRIRRIALLKARGQAQDESTRKILALNTRLVFFNLFLGAVVLSLTALARVS
jgi:hypothetical protein